MKTIQRLAALAGVVLLAFGAQAFAATAPGTVISNTATVDYEIAGTPYTEDSNTTTDTVAELVDVDVTRQGAASVNVNSPSSNQAVRFTITNLGNGNEQYNFAAANQGADDYDVTGIEIYLDDGDDVFEPGTDDGAAITDYAFTAGEFQDFWVSVDIPASLTDAEDADLTLTATSDDGTGTAGDSVAGAGDGGVDLVWGNSGGDDADSVEFNVLNLTFTFTKASVVTDPFGGNTVVPGSTIHYTITISATGAATASAIVVTDPIPNDTTFVASSIEFDSVANSDAADADECDHNVTNPGEISCTLPDMTGGDSHTIEFEVTID